MSCSVLNPPAPFPEWMHQDPKVAREAISRHADPLFTQVSQALEGALADGGTTTYWRVWSNTMEQAILQAAQSVGGGDDQALTGREAPCVKATTLKERWAKPVLSDGQ
eukprot:9024891-Alexandrium_andersonii.AAC.1